MAEAQAIKKAISDPTRLRILELFSQRDEWTAKEMAEALSLTPNSLYYHLRILEEAERIVVVGTRPGERMVERVYGTPDQEAIWWDLREPLEFSIHLAAILEAAKARGDEAIYQKARLLEEGDDPGYIAFNAPSFNTTIDEIREFERRLQALVSEFRERASKLGEERVARMRFTYLLHDEPIARLASAGA